MHIHGRISALTWCIAIGGFDRNGSAVPTESSRSTDTGVPMQRTLFAPNANYVQKSRSGWHGDKCRLYSPRKPRRGSQHQTTSVTVRSTLVVGGCRRAGVAKIEGATANLTSHIPASVNKNTPPEKNTLGELEKHRFGGWRAVYAVGSHG